MNPVAQRRANWRQTPDARLSGEDGAAAFVDAVGIATHYPASPEVASLYAAYMGEPEPKSDAKWDSPSGHVYTWRWSLGREEAAFYSTAVRKRPTWVAWPVVPALLRLRAELRAPDELADLGVISGNAYRVVQALEAAGGTLTTRQLRAAAGFPTGKEQRAAYLKAVEELDSRLMLAKVFLGEGDEMGHALVSMRYERLAEAAEAMAPVDAAVRVLEAYLPAAAFAAPTALAKHLGVDRATLTAGLERLEGTGAVRREAVDGYREDVWASVSPSS